MKVEPHRRDRTDVPLEHGGVGSAPADPGWGGGGAAFATVYRMEYPGLVRLAWLLTGDGALSEDVVQEAFSRLHHRFDEVQNPAAWLRTAVVNGCRDRYRRRHREERRLRLVHPRPLDDAGPDHSIEIEVLDALRSLPHRQRAALVMRYWLDLPEAEIAGHLVVQPSTVRSLVARGLATLRKELP